MWFIHQINPFLRLEMKSSSKRPVACFSGRWGTEITGKRSTSRAYSQSKCLYLQGRWNGEAGSVKGNEREVVKDAGRASVKKLKGKFEITDLLTGKHKRCRGNLRKERGDS